MFVKRLEFGCQANLETANLEMSGFAKVEMELEIIKIILFSSLQSCLARIEQIEDSIMKTGRSFSGKSIGRACGWFPDDREILLWGKESI